MSKIKDIKIKEKNEELEDESEIRNLAEELILFEEESENNKEIRKEIKAEAGDSPEPIKKLNITIQKFIVNLLKEQKNNLMKLYKETNEEIKHEEKKINFLEKKRKFQLNKDIEENLEEDSLSLKEKENDNKIKKYRFDNILIMFKRNLF